MKILFLAIILPFWSLGQTEGDLRILNPEYSKMLNRFLSHSVPEISCRELHSNFDDFVLLDTRTKAEFEISHLKNARWVDYNNFKLSMILDLPKDKAIICYCSIGYRSEKIVKKMINNGFINVQNLYGSIFEWSNLNYPLYKNENELTRSIHGYNKKWSKWIDSQTLEIVY